MVLALLLPTANTWARGGGGGGGYGAGGAFAGGGYSGIHGGGGLGRSNEDTSYWLGLLLTMSAAVLFYLLTEWLSKVWAARTGTLVPQAPVLASLVAVLNRGEHYVPALRALTAQSRFGTARGRAKARAALATLIAPEDVHDGFLMRAQDTGQRGQQGQAAQKLWQYQMSLAEITPEVLNVASPFQKVHRQEHSARREGVGLCVVGLVMTADADLLPAFGGADKTREALRRLGRIPSEAFYFYYAPGTGEALHLSEATALLARLRQGK